MHPNFERADQFSGEVIGAAVEVHRTLGPGLLESVYEKCLMRELELRSLSAVKRQAAACEDRVQRLRVRREPQVRRLGRRVPVGRTEGCAGDCTDPQAT